ncbi:MAG: extracellular solute-binding protein, partial [Spirochaetaceae bacterium]|nr:extracellular solute-binding protein [Spirochaetaceae bacterium]
MKKAIATSLIASVLLFAVALSGAAQSKQLVDIELWALQAVTEAGPPPDNWIGYQIIKDKLGINLKLVLQPSSPTDQDTKISVNAAANALPDLFGVNRDMLIKIARQGLVAPVDGLLPLMPVRTKGHYSDPLRKKLVTINGKMYGLPDPGAMDRVEGVVFRKDWLAKVGMKAPTTIDELYQVAKAFTTKDPDGNGKDDTYGFGAFFESTGLSSAGFGRRFDYILGAFGVPGMWNFESASKFQFNFRDPDFRKAVEFIKKINEERLIDPSWAAPNKDEFRARWKQGKFGIMWEQFAALSTKANYKDFDANFPSGEWIAIQPPMGPEGKSSKGLDQANARIYAVSAKAMKAGKGPAIASLLEWMASPEGYYLCGFGVEGVNYKKDAKGFITMDGIAPELAYTHKSQQPLTQLRNLVYVNNEIELAVRYPTYPSANGKTINPLAFWNFFKNTPYTDALGSSLITPPSNVNDFKRFYDENLIKFALGQQPLDDKNWEAFVKGMDSLGAKDIEKTAKAML